MKDRIYHGGTEARRIRKVKFVSRLPPSVVFSVTPCLRGEIFLFGAGQRSHYRFWGERKRSALGRPRALAPAARCRGWGTPRTRAWVGMENGSVMTPLGSPLGGGTGDAARPRRLNFFGCPGGGGRPSKSRDEKKCVPLYKGWGVNIFGQKSFCLRMWADISSYSVRDKKIFSNCHFYF